MQRTPRLPRLRLFVSRVWATRATPRHAPGVRFERVLPTGASHLVIRLGSDPLRLEKSGRDETLTGSALGGVHARAYRKDVSRPVACVGAMLAPGAIPALFGVPADAFAGRHVSLDAMIGNESDRIADRLAASDDLASRLDLFEAWLAARSPEVHGLHPGVARAIAASNHPETSAGALAARASLSPRRFSSVFREAVGVAPKRWLRLRRFQTVVERAGTPDVVWSDLACQLGYSDQAHLVREFREIADLTPTVYRRLAPPAANHVPWVGDPPG